MVEVSGSHTKIAYSRIKATFRSPTRLAIRRVRGSRGSLTQPKWCFTELVNLGYRARLNLVQSQCFRHFRFVAANEFFMGHHNRGDEANKWMSTEFRGNVSAKAVLVEVLSRQGWWYWATLVKGERTLSLFTSSSSFGTANCEWLINRTQLHYTARNTVLPPLRPKLKPACMPRDSVAAQ